MVSMQLVPGSLLIASATLLDPNFARCVLLVLNADSDGTLGVVLNRPTETPVGEVLSTWQDMTSEPGVFFRGGPVELNAALALGSLREGPEPSGWRPLTGSLGIVEAVAQEVAPFGIEVTIVEPGPAKTSFGGGLVSPPPMAVYERTPAGDAEVHHDGLTAIARRTWTAIMIATTSSTLTTTNICGASPWSSMTPNQTGPSIEPMSRPEYTKP